VENKFSRIASKVPKAKHLEKNYNSYAVGFIYAIRCNIHGEHVLHAPPFSVVVAVP